MVDPGAALYLGSALIGVFWPLRINLGVHCLGVVDLVEYLGADTFLYVNCDDFGTFTIRIGDVGKELKGEEVHMHFDLEHLHFFGEDARID